MMPRKKQAGEVSGGDLDSLKRLLILFLLKAGASQGEVAMALGVDQSAVSRMFSARKIKRFGDSK
jgi:predicted transcriptional regulator